jgi:hypothetical protein
MDFILETLLKNLSCEFNFGSYRPVPHKVSRVIVENTGQKLHAFYETRKVIYPVTRTHTEHCFEPYELHQISQNFAHFFLEKLAHDKTYRSDYDQFLFGIAFDMVNI